MKAKRPRSSKQYKEATYLNILVKCANLIYVEFYTRMGGFGNGRKFLEVTEEVILKKPIVVLKSGRTELGSKAALSHTGWLAGSYSVCEAALRQFDITIAQNFEELFDMTKALAMQPSAEGNSVAMVTNGAGPCVMAIDESIDRLHSREPERK